MSAVIAGIDVALLDVNLGSETSFPLVRDLNARLKSMINGGQTKSKRLVKLGFC